MNEPTRVVFYVDGSLEGARVVRVVRVIDAETLELEILDPPRDPVILRSKRAPRSPRPPGSWDFIV